MSPKRKNKDSSNRRKKVPRATSTTSANEPAKESPALAGESAASAGETATPSTSTTAHHTNSANKATSPSPPLSPLSARIAYLGLPDPRKRTGRGYTTDIMEGFNEILNEDTSDMGQEDYDAHLARVREIEEFVAQCGDKSPNQWIRDIDHEVDVLWGIA